MGKARGKVGSSALWANLPIVSVSAASSIKEVQLQVRGGCPVSTSSRSSNCARRLTTGSEIFEESSCLESLIIVKIETGRRAQQARNRMDDFWCAAAGARSRFGHEVEQAFTMSLLHKLRFAERGSVQFHHGCNGAGFGARRHADRCEAHLLAVGSQVGWLIRELDS